MQKYLQGFHQGILVLPEPQRRKIARSQPKLPSKFVTHPKVGPSSVSLSSFQPSLAHFLVTFSPKFSNIFLGYYFFLSASLVWRALNSLDGPKEWKTSKLSREPHKANRGQESDGIPGKKTQHDIMGIDPKELWARADRVTKEIFYLIFKRALLWPTTYLVKTRFMRMQT